MAVQVCFASLAIAGKMAMLDLPANAIVLTRVVCGAGIFLLIAKARGSEMKIARRDLPLLVLCALLGVVVNQLGFLNGLRRSTAVNATVIGSTIPVFTAAVAMLSRREPFRPLRVAGIVVALAGTLVLVELDRLSFSDDHALGNLMILVNAASYGTFLVVVRRLTPRIPPTALVAGLFAAAIPFVLPFGVPAWIEAAHQIHAREVGLLAFIVAVPTVGAYLLNQIALDRAESSLVAVYIYLQPILATVAAVLLLHERPGARTGIAALLVGAGLTLAAVAAPARAAPPPLPEAATPEP